MFQFVSLISLPSTKITNPDPIAVIKLLLVIKKALSVNDNVNPEISSSEKDFIKGKSEVADKLYEHKDLIDQFLYKRIVDLFDIKDSLVIYDLSNTYFEGRKASSKIAKYGKSKEKRNDCKQVVFTGVINTQGFIRYSKIYDAITTPIT